MEKTFDTLEATGTKLWAKKNYLPVFFLLLTIGLMANFLLLTLNDARTFHSLSSSHKLNDFLCAYDAANALIAGANPYLACPPPPHTYFFYPPFYAFFLAPLTHFSFVNATIIWTIANVFFLGISLFLFFRLLVSSFQLSVNRWQAWGCCSLAMLLTYNPILWVFRYGQCDLLVVAAFALSLFSLKRTPSLAGFILGIIACIKYQSIIFLPWLILRGQWRGVAGFLMGIIFAIWLPALFLGWHTNLEYLKIALSALFHMDLVSHLNISDITYYPPTSWSANVSITSGLIRIFMDNHSPIKEGVYVIALIASFLFLLIRYAFRRNNIDFIWRNSPKQTDSKKEMAISQTEWFILIILLLMFSPQCIKRHFTLLLGVNLFVAMMFIFPISSFTKIGVGFLALLNQFLMIRFFPAWDHWGGPGWGLLPLLIIILFFGLSYCQKGLHEHK
jgi:hypothetical protein